MGNPSAIFYFILLSYKEFRILIVNKGRWNRDSTEKKNTQKPYFATMPNAYLCEARLDVMGSKLIVTL